MRTALSVVLLVLFGVAVGLGSYYGGGHADALDDAPLLVRQANKLIARGESGEGLGPGREAVLLALQDPNFAQRDRFDFRAPGSSKMALTQSLARLLAFDHFEPGIMGIRQAGYARGLEKRLSQRQVLALWLETVEMGQGPNGWMRGFFDASWIIYGRPPSRLSDAEFLRLGAVLAAPSRFNLQRHDPALDAWMTDAERLLAATCKPRGLVDARRDRCPAE